MSVNRTSSDLAISLEAVTFLRELREHNAKSWFDEHRKRYEKLVRDPFKELCDEIIARLHHADSTLPGLSAEQIASIPENASDGIMRINRDLRFSKDKTPYHTYLRAAFVPQGRKSGNAGLYLTIEPDLVGAGGGVYRSARAYEPGLPALPAVPLAPEYREQINSIHEAGLKKNEPVIAMVHLTPEKFFALDDIAGWITEQFSLVSPLVGALQ